MTRETLSFNPTPSVCLHFKKLLTSWDTSNTKSSLLLRFFFIKISNSYFPLIRIPHSALIKKLPLFLKLYPFKVVSIFPLLHHLSRNMSQPSKLHCTEVEFNKLLYTSRLCTQSLHKNNYIYFCFKKLLIQINQDHKFQLIIYSPVSYWGLNNMVIRWSYKTWELSRYHVPYLKRNYHFIPIFLTTTLLPLLIIKYCI